MTKNAFAYLITIRTYSTWVHGDERGSVDSKNNVFGSPKISSMQTLADHMLYISKETPLILNADHRHTLLHTVIDTVKYNHWHLFAAHVRSNHLHCIVQAEAPIEKVMGKIKCYGTKTLKTYHSDLSSRKNFWARHGSTRYIWAAEKLFPALYSVSHLVLLKAHANESKECTIVCMTEDD